MNARNINKTKTTNVNGGGAVGASSGFLRCCLGRLAVTHRRTLDPNPRSDFRHFGGYR